MKLKLRHSAPLEMGFCMMSNLLKKSDFED